MQVLHSKCTIWCVWIKRHHVSSTLNAHLPTSLFKIERCDHFIETQQRLFTGFVGIDNLTPTYLFTDSVSFWLNQIENSVLTHFR